jgi:uncharacterized Zn finger protein
LYDLHIRIKTLPAKKWSAIRERCAGQVGSLLELLQGKLSNHVMEVVTDRKDGLFPLPKEISLNCDCPDWAVMCKHVAAVLYGVGARLDRQPELLFKLRGVDHEELIDADAEAAVSAATSRGKSKRLADGELSDVFGIDLDTSEDAATKRAPRKKRSKTLTAGTRGKKVAKKKAAAKKMPKKTTKRKVAKKTVKKKTDRKTAAKKKTTTKKGVKKPATRKKAGKKKAPKKATRKPR